jgi:hypothetical protein
MVQAFLSQKGGGDITTAIALLIVTAIGSRDFRSAKQNQFAEFPDFSNVRKLVSPATRAALREAIAAHWKVASAALKEGELSPVGPAHLAIIEIEASDSLTQAIDAIEALWSECHRPQEKEQMRYGFALVLLRCRGFFSSELASDYNLRRRLVFLSEEVLAANLEYYKGTTAQTTALGQVLLADQFLAICSIEPKFQPSPGGRLAIEDIVKKFEAYCFDNEANPPVLRPNLKNYAEAYKRVLTRLQD